MSDKAIADPEATISHANQERKRGRDMPVSVRETVLSVCQPGLCSLAVVGFFGYGDRQRVCRAAVDAGRGA
jgi:hypothetical protein